MERRTYAETTPAELMQQRWPDVQDLRLGYYAQMIGPERSSVFVQTDPLNWAYPNRTVGTPLNRAGQRYARPQVVTQASISGIYGYCLTADNTSSARHEPFGSIDRFAKLHVDSFKSHRYRVLRELIAPDQTSTYVLAALALRTCNDQPVSVYVWRGEEYLEELVAHTGFEQAGETEDIRIGQYTVEQTAYKANDSNRMFSFILGIIGSDEIQRGLFQLSTP